MNEENKPSVGCSKEKQCPCRTWVQCRIYVDKKKQEQRLKRKEYIMIKLWYQENFRVDYNL